MVGHPASEEQKRKASESMKKYKKTAEHCKNISEAKTGKPRINKPGTIPGMLGKHHSEETKKKMSEAHKGKPRDPEHIEKWVKTRKDKNGYVMSEEQKQQISKTLTGKTQSKETKNKRAAVLRLVYQLKPELKLKTSHYLEDHWNWQGGKSYEEYPIEFDEEKRIIIRHLHKNLCVLCGKTPKENGEALCVHHIDYDKNNNEDNNLIPLCRECHLSTNYNRESWTPIFIAIKEDMRPLS